MPLESGHVQSNLSHSLPPLVITPVITSPPSHLWLLKSITQLCLTPATPWTDCSPPGSSVHRISQESILEWFTISFSRGSSQPRDWIWVSHIGGRQERNGKPLQYCCLENRMNNMTRQKDMTPKDELPRSVGAQYATGEEWRNDSRKNEETEPKQK